ncbi:amino acid adenylation domain-containing protein [Amycolatopsis sp. cg13]|uniref:amino acid adenylation domain-containing protein n=1 Tax=Amycolatopsis sp. cg13 TaxID=3238807 RepID=UPI003524939F
MTTSVPLTEGQKDIWFDEKLTGGGPAYNTAAYWDIRGPLDHDVFRAAVRRLVDEAECTRTRYVESDGEPRQIVEALPEIPMTEHDLTGAADPDAAAREWIARDLREPFDIAEFPLFRLALLRTGPGRALFYMCNHHLMSDGYSYVVYWQRLAAIYEAMTDGTSLDDGAFPPLTALLEAEAAYRGSPAADRDRLFWAGRFAEPPEPVSLATTDAAPGPDFWRKDGVLPVPVAQQLRDLAWQQRVNWQAVVAAALAAYTSRLAGVPDVVLSLPVHARVDPRSRAVPGMVNNYLPLPVSVRPGMTRDELVTAVSRDFAKTLKHQRRRVSRIRREMGLASDDRRPFGPFLNIIPQVSELRIGECRVLPHSPATGLVDDLEVTVADTGAAGLQVNVSGNAARYSEDEVGLHLARFTAFLERFGSQGDGDLLAGLDVLLPGEAETLRAAGTATTAEDYIGVVERIRAAAARTPSAVAVSDGEGELTYAQLVGRASALARRLPSDGITAVLAERGAGFVVGVVGALTAGSAFLPLDTGLPTPRLAALVSGGAVRCIVADAAHRELAEAIAVQTQVVVLDDGVDGEDGLVPTRGYADDLAYVIHTSGSTGKPKGVMVHRRGMVNHLLAKAEDLALSPTDVVACNAPVTFDVSVWQMLAPLIVGAQARVTTRETAADPELLFGDKDLTILEVVPSLLRAAVESWPEGRAPRLPGLRWLLVTGEALPGQLCRDWAARYPGIPLMNAYGPTECSDDVTHAVIRAGESEGVRAPIGRPVRGTSLRVLGDDLRPVPPGVAGELYVGGTGVGRGYLDDPAGTALAFIPDPAGRAGERMYRTGDRVRMRRDGQLEFLQRRDHQVKIRGHRIELDEVEAGLRALPAVADAVAAVDESGGRKRLVGYVVAAGPADPDRIRADLAETLPEYLIPAVCVVLDEMPLTPAGKIDRKALPRPAAFPEKKAAARTRTERILTGVLAEVLGVHAVGVDDSFFALGGDSINAIQVVARARAAGLALTPRDVFRHKSVAALAEVAAEIVETAVRPADSDGVGELEPTPAGYGFREDVAARVDHAAAFSQYVVLDVPPGLSVAGLVEAMQAVLDCHDALRTRLQVPAEGVWALEIQPPGSVHAADVVIGLSAMGADEVLADATARLSPQAGVMVQAVLLDGHTLVLVAHHLAVDGVSWRILLPDLMAAWQHGTEPRPVGTSLRRWSRMLTDEARTAKRVSELPVWLNQVRGAEPLLGTRALDPAIDRHGTAQRLGMELPASLTAALLTEVPAAFHAEIDEILLAALTCAVVDWRRRRGSAVREVVLELEGHGREQISDDVDISRTIGWFTSVYPVRLELGADELWSGPALAGLVKSIKEQLRAVPRGGLGFGLLRHLNRQTSAALAEHSVPQIGFNYLGRFDGSMIRASGVSASPDMPMRHVLELDAVVMGRPEGPVLAAEWRWAGELLTAEEGEDLARTWQRVLVLLAASAGEDAGGGHTPSDFAMVDLSQEEIEAFETTGAVADVLPLSPLQQGLLFQAEFDRNGLDVYTLQVAMDGDGPLDQDRLAAAAAALLERHPSLRASFRYRSSGDSVQVIAASATARVDEVRLAGPVELAEFTDAEWLRRFDVSQPPLIRFTVARLSADRFRLIVTAHHILVDGWSMSAILGRELLTLLAADGAAGALPAPVPSTSYHLWLAAQDKHSARAAWATELEGVAGPTKLGPDERGQVSVLPELLDVELPSALSSRLGDFARTRGLTLNTVVQGCWAVLLGRLTGRDDVVFGTVHSGRPPQLPGVEDMVGVFMHTLPVRVRLDPHRTVVETMAELQERQSALAEHQHLGLAEIQREAGAGELFDTVVSYHNYPVDSVGRLDGVLPGVTVLGWQARVISEYPLALSVHPGESVRLQGQYRPDVFSRARISGLVDRFVALLGKVVDEPEVRLGRLDVLTPAERGRALGEWAGTGRRAPAQVVPEVFESRVRKASDASAIVHGAVELTYHELNERANRLARLLIRHGVGPERTVALALPRTVESAVATLAVLKAGGAFLPIDPAYPANRISYLIEDAAPAVVVTDAETHERLPLLSLPVILLDESDAELAELAGDNIGDDERTSPLSPANSAYVIYTSGSTGRPKGVVADHSGFVAMIDGLAECVAAGPADRVLQFASYSFDFAVWELFVALLEGGLAVVVGDENRAPGKELVDLVNTAGITLAGLPPAVVAALPEDAVLPTGLTLVVAGEACPPAVAARWAPRLKMINGYGPTESVVGATMSDPLSGKGRPQIGRPTSAHRVYVLDGNLQPVLPGVVGELYVSGCLARGYHGRPSLTAGRFVADPFSGQGERMYRTGDLVSWLADGSLDYVGRADDQVQLRGLRIELPEIESVLVGHDGVVQAAAMVREDIPGDPRLVAYIVPADGSAAVPSGLRDHIAESLPESMVPSAYVPLAELPITTQGKLDRAALPAPQIASPRSRAPRNPIEEILCGVFAEVLGLPEIGIDDDFFDFGGHSMLATRAVAKARALLGVELPIRALFESRTVALLADHVMIAGDARPALAPAAPPADGGDRTEPLSFAQRRLWFLHRLEGQSGTYNVPLALRMSGKLDSDALQAALRDLVERHDVLRAVFPGTDGQPYQRILSAPAGYPLLRAVRLRDQDLARALALEAGTGFDLAAAPAMRATLFVLGPQEHLLLLVFHHIVFDGWSIEPLTRDLLAAYRARRAGQDPQWTPLAARYGDYTAWQRELLGTEDNPSEIYRGQLQYWRENLAGIPEELPVPADFPRPALNSHRGGQVTFAVEADLYRGLTALARSSGASLFMVLQAALAGLLTKLGCGTDIPLGSPIGGRTDVALNDLVGFFVNTFVLRADTSGDPTFAELIGRVREADLAAYANQDLPFDDVVEALNPARSLAKQPLFQVMIALEKGYGPPAGLPGLTVRGEFVPSATTQFDLNFQFLELEGPDGEDELSCLIDYSRDLFTGSTVTGFGERLVRLLRAAVADPGVRLREVDLLSASERHTMLVRWNDTAHRTPASTLPVLFEEQAARTPDVPAVVAGADRLTYSELNRAANRLAWRLARSGAGPERIVAIALPRSTELVVAALAVLKTGAAYLPLDPENPAERTAGMLGETDPVCLIADRSPVPDAGVPTVLLDEPGPEYPEHNLAVPIRPDHAAYVIYTSGSTGRPKGTVVEHRAVVNYLSWAVAAYPALRSGALVPSRLSFDLTVTGLYGPLTCGGTVHLAELAEGAVAANQRPAFLKGTPSHLALLQVLPDQYSPHAELVLGGEPLPGDELDRWRSAHPGVRVCNEYGPTETTVGCTWLPIEADDVVRPEILSIGRPIWNTQAYVLDAALNPVPCGVTGELYVAGENLSRGYLSRQALTARRFVANPFGEPGSRMYRTGDLVRWTADGRMSFAGRTDGQVKIRGFRVELGEVESVLARHGSVRHIAVAEHGDKLEDRGLVAYVVPADPSDWDPSDLAAFAARELPAYMVPSDVVALDELPLTANGKLDRAALPSPERADRPEAGSPAEGLTTAEAALCRIMAGALKRPSLGVEANFFDEGGDSVRVIRVVNEARAEGLPITLADVFVNQTPRSLAASIAPRPEPARANEAEAGSSARVMADAFAEVERAADTDPFATVLRMRPGGERNPLFCVHSGVGFALPYLGLAKHLGPEYPLYGLQDPSVTELAPAPRSVGEMADDYVRRIKQVQPSGPYHLLGWSFGGIVAYEIAARLQAGGDEVGVLANLDSYPRAGEEQRDDEQVMFGWLLELIGHSRSEFAGREVTAADLHAVLVSDGSPLAALGIERLSAMVRGMRSHEALLHGYVPSRYRGRMLLFTAAGGLADGAVKAKTSRWRPYVDGEVAAYRISAAHDDMMSAEPLAQVAVVVTGELDRQADR